MLCCRQDELTCVQLPTRVLEVELTLVSSNHHVEMNPSDVGNNDRYVVQEILKVSPTDDTLVHADMCIIVVCETAHPMMPSAPAVFILKMFTTQQMSHLVDFQHESVCIASHIACSAKHEFLFCNSIAACNM